MRSLTTGATNCVDAPRDDDAAGLEKAGARVVQRLDDVLLEGIVAERLRHDDVDFGRIDHLGRVAGHQVRVARAVGFQRLAATPATSAAS